VEATDRSGIPVRYEYDHHLLVAITNRKAAALISYDEDERVSHDGAATAADTDIFAVILTEKRCGDDQLPAETAGSPH
jgi:YD repeat-containing protein